MPVTFSNYQTGKTIYYKSGERYRDQYIEKDARKYTERFFNKFKSETNKALQINHRWTYKDDVIIINDVELLL